MATHAGRFAAAPISHSVVKRDDRHIKVGGIGGRVRQITKNCNIVRCTLLGWRPTMRTVWRAACLSNLTGLAI